MRTVRADEARRFSEEDEDPRVVIATFDAAEKGRTSQPGRPGRGERRYRWVGKARHALAGILHKAANTIDPQGMRAH
jgi:hypothetical protein